MRPVSDPDAAIPPVTIIIASVDRPRILDELLDDLRGQTQAPDEIILSVTKTADLPSDLVPGAPIRILHGPKGSCAQRNAALENLHARSEIIIFCDDDYVPSRFFVERVRAFFLANPDVAGASGQLLADGINGPGIALEDARAMVARHDAGAAPRPAVFRERFGLYGCNMAFRRAAISGIRFDERLPLYGWQEDIDFAAQVRQRGRIVSTRAFAGVHRGVKQGRSSGIRVGYSQVVNPAYLARKGTMRPGYALKIVVRNVAANHWRVFQPEAWVDRLGRLKGNWLGLFDLMRGRITPERIARL